MKARQRGKAMRRYRLRIDKGWAQSDATRCFEAEVLANAYQRPEVTLGREPAIGKVPA